MSAPPHSIESFSGAVESDRFSDRNNFLMLLLGLISVSEQVLAFVPNLGLEQMPQAATRDRGARAHPDATSLLR